MRVNAAIVAYENPRIMLDAAIQSILQEENEIHKLYLIDNSPTDRLAKHFSAHTEYIYNNKNLGFGKANNIAMQKSIDDNIEYHILINPDIYFNKGVIKELVAFMDSNPDVGLVTPKIIYPDESTQYLCKLMPTPMDLIARRFLCWGPFRKYVDRRNEVFELRNSGYSMEMDIPAHSGSFMMIRTSILKEVGLFDERFFLYLEDFDLCRRVGKVSRTTFYPKVTVVHEYKKGSYYQRRLFGYHIISAIKYFNKWGWFFDSHRKKVNRQSLGKV